MNYLAKRPACNRRNDRVDIWTPGDSLCFDGDDAERPARAQRNHFPAKLDLNTIAETSAECHVSTRNKRSGSIISAEPEIPDPNLTSMTVRTNAARANPRRSENTPAETSE